MTNQQPGPGGWFNWGVFEQWFKQNSPLQNIPFFFGQGTDWSWLQDYMKQFNEQMTGSPVPDRKCQSEANAAPASPRTQQQAALNSQNGNFHYELIDLSHKMKARLHLPEETDLKRIKLFAGDHQLRVEGLPKDQTEIIPLPCKVASRMGKAVFQDGLLEVSLFKDTGVHLQEMNIEFKL
ncbi:hypothetical protein ABNB59_07390 [Paenibacillus larvae]|nr:hypothetical protein [Paenibacillus larvae]AQR79121.1 hypothetical protein BXP28_19720 [Paenibacillus larvae subsp. larvae]AQT85469.1 hypothetical protein B1222_15375 [Paenibacillus larvae subsp. pulvifaciens]AQZ47477.1 hypothetical protein B5S25_13720 [Paenibacillus larvae subsp. pulvifaciens]AVF23759.1 hypothetical protein ERICI_04030 [Paenibacillus larvae subsp. larvae]AVF24826.1 hypothetical protein ERICIII_00606 [Paenibacillus larvae subsp. larvae]